MNDPYEGRTINERVIFILDEETSSWYDQMVVNAVAAGMEPWAYIKARIEKLQEGLETIVNGCDLSNEAQAIARKALERSDG